MTARSLDYTRTDPECFSLYGYGSGRAGREYCGVDCPVGKACWRATVEEVKALAPPGDMLWYSDLVRGFLKKGCSPQEARRRTTERLISMGKTDPYLENVARNTQRGWADKHAPFGEEYRKIKGAVWQYHGVVFGRYSVAED